MIPVTVAQRGLVVLHYENRAIPDAGRVDGAWGPRTQAAFEAWARSVSTPATAAPQTGAATNLVTITPTAAETALQHASNYYDRVVPAASRAERAGHARPPAITPPVAVVRSGGMGVGSVVAGLLVGAAAVGLAVWYFRSRA